MPVPLFTLLYSTFNRTGNGICMSGKKRYFAIVFVLSVLLLSGCEEGGAGSKAASARDNQIAARAETRAEAKGYVGEVGDRAVPFTLTTFTGDTFNLTDAIGGPVLINLWASWCGPCKYEAPELQRAYEAYKDKGVVFVGVALQDTVESSTAFIKRFGWTFPAGPDDTGDIMKAYRAMAIPMTYIVDAKGFVTYIHIGAINEETIKRELDRLL